MARRSVIERISAERKKKRMSRLRPKKKKAGKVEKELSLEDLERMKVELESKLSGEKKEEGKSADELMLDKIKAELASKKTAEGGPVGDLKSLDVLVEDGTKEDWLVFFGQMLKNNIKMEFPPIDPEKCKFPGYGYKELIELMIQSEDFLRMVIDIKDVSGFQLVGLNHLIRGDDPTLRGIEALCNLIINKEVRYNPVMETDFKYLNIILDAFTIAKKVGINKTWKFKAGDETITISASFDKAAREWQYKINIE